MLLAAEVKLEDRRLVGNTRFQQTSGVVVRRASGSSTRCRRPSFAALLAVVVAISIGTLRAVGEKKADRRPIKIEVVRGVTPVIINPTQLSAAEESEPLRLEWTGGEAR